jgi:hypothetical protein
MTVAAMFEFVYNDQLRCADCESAITLTQYRRKVPRCDECEVSALLAVAFDGDFSLLWRDGDPTSAGKDQP